MGKINFDEKPELRADIEKICNTVDEFAEQMKHRMIDKAMEGFTGWDDETGISTVDILYRLAEKQPDLWTDHDPIYTIDWANYLMMIWLRTKFG